MFSIGTVNTTAEYLETPELNLSFFYAAVGAATTGALYGLFLIGILYAGFGFRRVELSVTVSLTLSSLSHTSSSMPPFGVLPA